jgi:hypothetical protein
LAKFLTTLLWWKKTYNRHMLHLRGFAWVTGNMKFNKLQDRVLADLDFRNRLVSYLQMSIFEVVDEIWADEYKDSHPDLDSWMTPTTQPISFGRRWRPIQTTFSRVARSIATPSPVSNMVERSWYVREGFIRRRAKCKTYVCM